MWYDIVIPFLSKVNNQNAHSIKKFGFFEFFSSVHSVHYFIEKLLTSTFYFLSYIFLESLLISCCIFGFMQNTLCVLLESVNTFLKKFSNEKDFYIYVYIANFKGSSFSCIRCKFSSGPYSEEQCFL